MSHNLLSPPDDHSPSGIISNHNQRRWAQLRSKPNRCILSTVGRCIVIRPDHFCKWSESWIGKRNQNFYLLFNIYGVLYLACFLAVDIMKLVDILIHHFSLFVNCVYHSSDIWNNELHFCQITLCCLICK
jgi:hypothetical protein